MRKTQQPIFATPEDWRNLIASVLLQRPITMVKAGLFCTSQVQAVDDGKYLDPFGSYLVVDKATKVLVRPVLQRSGETKYAIDQLENSGSVVLHLAAWQAPTVLWRADGH